MTCQRCHDEAAVHLTETVDGNRQELHLCLPCAQKAGLALPASPPKLGLDQVVQGLIVAHVGELVGELAELTCPDCGVRFMEFRTKGGLGCPTDYQVFARGLLPLILRSHGATRHVGKVPSRPAEETGRARLRLRSDFRAAIAREDYEQAAKLRDQLRPKDADR
ncbi:UvrB/UvrC motif-containing protein [Tundrisphaera lichenicola]|uniref:UvrB/UvrC motif-containing protein n=1 Tax=Tundrisphaera lichenicola TaxID=2029860 RepID=UPI003EBD674C